MLSVVRVCLWSLALRFHKWVNVDFACGWLWPHDFYFPSLLSIFLHGLLFSLTVIFAWGGDVPLHKQVFILVNLKRILVIYRPDRLHFFKIPKGKNTDPEHPTWYFPWSCPCWSSAWSQASCFLGFRSQPGGVLPETGFTFCWCFPGRLLFFCSPRIGAWRGWSWFWSELSVWKFPFRSGRSQTLVHTCDP